jgi:tetratricopeptide (TPR) repeat protein
MSGKRWQGWLGNLRPRPWLALAIGSVCVLIVALAGYLIGLQLWAGHHWRAARRAAEDWNWSAAKKHLDACLSVWPTGGEVHFLTARVCRRGGDLDNARVHLRRAEELGWLTELLDLEYLLLQAESGSIRSVEKALQSSMRAGHVEIPLILEAMVRGFMRANLLREAYRYADIWVRHCPEDWQAYFHRGMVMHRQALTNAPFALEDYRRAVQLRPEQPEPRLRLAQLLEFTGQYTEALPHFVAYRERYPEQADGIIGMARCLFSMGEVEQANQLLDGLLAMHPGDAGACFLKAKLALEADAAEEAVAWLIKADKDLAQSNVDYQHTLALAYRRLGNVDEADKHQRLKKEIEQDMRRVQEITQILADDDKNVELRFEAATILARRGEIEDAARWLLSVLQFQPEHRAARKALATLLRQTGDPKLAGVYKRVLGGEREVNGP